MTGVGRHCDARANDYGLSRGMMTDTGGLMMGELIKLNMDIELVKVEAEAASIA